MHVIATAGHVDHGKSALVQALTGIDPDRLQEEKERGLTIDLGFAWLTLPSGDEVSIVDVPGHERFVKNMLAGVGGIDLALLVVAADEGIMPQTREHLAILDLLGVARGVVALSKSDLVDEQWLDLVREDVAGLLAETTLAGSPIVACSARTGTGLADLLAVLAEELATVPARSDRGRPRLPIDRVFTIAGFGTVVTGTLLHGSLKVGDEVEILPGGARARVRGLQNHKQKTDLAVPGRRTAVNLAGIGPDRLARGMQLARPGTLATCSLADVSLRVLPDRRVRHGARVMLHHFSAETEARITLLEDETVAGGEGWAQLRLAAPLPLVRGDHFVIRAGGDTIGGGTVVDLPLKRHRRRQRETVDRLSDLAAGQTSEVQRLVEQIGPCPRDQFLKHLGEESEAERLLDQEIEAGDVIECGGWILSTDQHQALLAAALEQIREYHRRYPLRLGVPREELREKLGIRMDAGAALVGRWSAEGLVQLVGSAVALPGWQPELTTAQQDALKEFVAALEAQPYSPEATPIDAELAAYAENAGQIVHVGELYFSRAAYDEMTERVIEAARAEPVTLAQVRDMFGTSRRYAQALLEHLDQLRITRRIGDARVLRRPGSD